MQNRLFVSPSLPAHLELHWNSYVTSELHSLQASFVAANVMISLNLDLQTYRLNASHLDIALATLKTAYEQALMQQSAASLTVLFNPFYCKQAQLTAQPIHYLEQLLCHLAQRRPFAELTDLLPALSKILALQTFFIARFQAEIKQIQDRAGGNNRIECLAAYIHQQPVGWLTCESYNAGVYVRWFTVRPSQQRNGIGELMLKAVEKRYSTLPKLALTTLKDNEQARAFYAKTGLETKLISVIPAQPFREKVAAYRTWLSTETTQKENLLLPEGLSTHPSAVGYAKRI